MATIEKRRAELRLESRSGQRRLVGYAALYGVVAEIGGKFRERIAPGAFAASLSGTGGEGDDILALLDHDAARVLGRTRSKTLRLDDDTKGLAFEIAVPDTSAGRDALALAERGDLGGASIGFFVEEEARDGDVRVVKRAKLLEISIVSSWPAYQGTNVEARRAVECDRQRGPLHFASPTARRDALRRYLETC